jgi:hypothetical protein
MHERPPLAQWPAAALRIKATEYRRMAETARMTDIKVALLRLADRFDALVDRREQGERCHRNCTD